MSDTAGPVCARYPCAPLSCHIPVVVVVARRYRRRLRVRAKTQPSMCKRQPHHHPTTHPPSRNPHSTRTVQNLAALHVPAQRRVRVVRQLHRHAAAGLRPRRRPPGPGGGGGRAAHAPKPRERGGGAGPEPAFDEGAVLVLRVGRWVVGGWGEGRDGDTSAACWGGAIGT